MKQKQLKEILTKHSGRTSSGKITAHHQGGRQKRYYRFIDFRRDKYNIPATVEVVEFDPNRSANIALLVYSDGERRYILSPVGLKTGDTVISGPNAEIKTGNTLPIGLLPIGTQIHNIELIPGNGGKIARAAGTAAVILAKETDFAHVKLASGEVRKVNKLCYVTIGQLGNEERRSIPLGTAGRARRLGKRPEVRGTAQNPRSHPHGGGEGRSGIGMPSPKTPWGKKAMGIRTRKAKKYSNKFIVEKRK